MAYDLLKGCEVTGDYSCGAADDDDDSKAGAEQRTSDEIIRQQVRDSNLVRQTVDKALKGNQTAKNQIHDWSKKTDGGNQRYRFAVEYAESLGTTIYDVLSSTPSEDGDMKGDDEFIFGDGDSLGGREDRLIEIYGDRSPSACGAKGKTYGPLQVIYEHLLRSAETGNPQAIRRIKRLFAPNREPYVFSRINDQKLKARVQRILQLP